MIFIVLTLFATSPSLSCYLSVPKHKQHELVMMMCVPYIPCVLEHFKLLLKYLTNPTEGPQKITIGMRLVFRKIVFACESEEIL